MPPPPSRTSSVDAVLVALGGATGSVARWGLAEAVPGPWSTLAVNLSGCLAIGLCAGWLFARHPRLRMLLGVGFLGGYTTFATHLLDARDLLDEPLRAAAYVGGTLVGCVALAAGGLRLGQALVGRGVR